MEQRKWYRAFEFPGTILSSIDLLNSYFSQQSKQIYRESQYTIDRLCSSSSFKYIIRLSFSITWNEESESTNTRCQRSTRWIYNFEWNILPFRFLRWPIKVKVPTEEESTHTSSNRVKIGIEWFQISPFWPNLLINLFLALCKPSWDDKLLICKDRWSYPRLVRHWRIGRVRQVEKKVGETGATDVDGYPITTGTQSTRLVKFSHRLETVFSPGNATVAFYCSDIELRISETFHFKFFLFFFVLTTFQEHFHRCEKLIINCWLWTFFVRRAGFHYLFGASLKK